MLLFHQGRVEWSGVEWLLNRRKKERMRDDWAESRQGFPSGRTTKANESG